MGNFAKWIGGGLGWAFGGPVGALIGFAIGSMIGGAESMGTTRSIGSARTTEGDFKMSLLVLMACIMKADGRIDKAELAVVKKFLVANFGEQGALEAMPILKNLLEQQINETEVAAQIGQNLNYSSKLELLHLLFNIAYADGEVVNSELATIQRIATIFRIDRLDFESIKAPYMKQVDRGRPKTFGTPLFGFQRNSSAAQSHLQLVPDPIRGGIGPGLPGHYHNRFQRRLGAFNARHLGSRRRCACTQPGLSYSPIRLYHSRGRCPSCPPSGRRGFFRRIGKGD